MIKKIFRLILGLLVFLFVLFVFWPTVSPRSYYLFWSKFPTLTARIETVCPSCFDIDRAFLATTSESVREAKGRIVRGDDVWTVEIVRDDSDRARGLSGRELLERNTGMLFVFDGMDYRHFWMKDMLIYIDMIFLDENWNIVLIEGNLSPDSFPKTFGGDVKSKYVLEISGGEAEIYNLKVGERLIFLND